MHNISTIYRFYTPFLDIESEKNNLTGVMKKIEKSLIFDGIKFDKKTEKQDKYYKISLYFYENMGKIDLYYLENLLEDQYFLPIFKCDIYLNNKFLLNNITKKRTVLFLNNVFECFDGLDEKEYLIDIDNSLFYKKGYFNLKEVTIQGKPERFDRKKFLVYTDKGNIDIWEESKK